MLIALAQTLILVALGLLFGVLENTTDKEFKLYGLADSSLKDISGRTMTLIIGLAIIMGVALFIGDLFYENAMINWLMFIVVTGGEIAYFVWVMKISDRVREMVTGVCLMLATWPAFCRISLNLRDYSQMDATGLARIIVMILAVVFIAVVIARVVCKDKFDFDPTKESEGEYSEN